MTIGLDRRTLAALRGRRGNAIADALDAAIAAGEIAAGERLPPVRHLATELGVSGATVAGAYDELARRGRTRGEVGRGTFVKPTSAERLSPGVGSPDLRPNLRDRPVGSGPWRRRLMRQSSARLAAAHPEAEVCADGLPDERLLPLDILRRAHRRVVRELTAAGLQYAGAQPIDELAAVVARRLRGEGMIAAAEEVAVANSSIQLVEFAIGAAARRRGAGPPLVAVEEPGYPSVLDAVDRLGWPMIGMPVDSEGVVPDRLDGALDGGAGIAVLTPRAHNPTGASWSTRRRDELAEVLRRHPRALVIEDDHAADIAVSAAISLRGQPDLVDQVVAVRSFSKAIAPDLRVAVAVASPPLRAHMIEEKGTADGWTSRMAQRVLAMTLGDPDLDAVLDRARHAYAERRAAALAVFEAAGVSVVAARDGTNLWIRLDAGIDEATVLEQAAEGGVVALSGEPFLLRPGCSGCIRLTVGCLDPRAAGRAAEVLAAAALRPRSTSLPGAVT